MSPTSSSSPSGDHDHCPSGAPSHGRAIVTRLVLLAAAVGLVWLALTWTGTGSPPPQPAATATGASKLAAGTISGPASSKRPSAPAVQPDAKAAPKSSATQLRPANRRSVWIDVPPRDRTAAALAAKRGGPLVIGLHGRGDTAANFAQLAERFPDTLAWRVLQANSRFSAGFAWFLRDSSGRPTGIAASVAAVDAQITAAHGRSPGGHRPIVLFGFSQGCMIILHYLVAHPDAVRGAVCIGGRVVGPLATAPEGTTRPPILFINGLTDRVVPAPTTRAAIQTLEAQGFPTEHIEHSGGHRIPTLELGRIGSWMVRLVAQDDP